MRLRFIAATALMIVASCGLAMSQIDEVTAKLIGTWKLVSITREEIPSGLTADLMGSNPKGFISYSPDGRMMVLIMRGDRKKPEGASPTPAEAQDLFRSMVSYTGTFKVDGDKVTHFVDASWNESWAGTSQTRFFKFDGNRVSLSTEVSPDPINGKISVRTMTWERTSR